jgi:hypothetical protein
MRKSLLLTTLLLLLGSVGFAQTYPLVSIHDIQFVSSTDLGNCLQASSMAGDTVRVQGLLVQDPDSAALTDNNSFQFWMRDGYGDFSGIDVIGFFDPNMIGVSGLQEGDSIEITGVVTEFGNAETEIIPLDNAPVTILGAFGSLAPTVVANVGLINDNTQTNNLPTGETWEGQYIELQDLTVTSVDPFSSGTRVSFVVQDGNGNKINISDKYIIQRLPNGSPAGHFVLPNVGDNYCYIRGVLGHSPNGCMGGTGRGYELYPTRGTDYSICTSAPSIISVTRNYVTPTSAQAVTVSAQITDVTLNVASATLHYAVGVGNTTYITVAMTLSSGTNTSGVWTADIPAQADGAFVKYYVSAVDNNGNTSNSPAVPSGSDPKFYTVRDNGTTIFDVQFVPSSFSNANSGYDDLDVTVTGVVVASAEANNLGYVFIQQENQLQWAGIMCTDNAALASLTMGQKVTVTGTVNESFSFTRLEQISQVSINGTGSITASVQDPSVFTDAFSGIEPGEPYEGMLVTLQNSTSGQPIYVVDANCDDPSNFAEYRLGEDVFTSTDGCRVLAGRQTASTFSSLNVSYVNDPQWASIDGIMNVPVIQVFDGNQFTSATGIIAYLFGNYKLLPRNNADMVGFGVSNDEGMKNSVKAYPNPVADQFRLAYNVEAAANGGTATVYDMMGRPMQTVKLDVTSGETLVNVSSLAAGNYIVKVSNADGLLNIVKIQKVQ